MYLGCVPASSKLIARACRNSAFGRGQAGAPGRLKTYRCASSYTVTSLVLFTTVLAEVLLVSQQQLLVAVSKIKQFISLIRTFYIAALIRLTKPFRELKVSLCRATVLYGGFQIPCTCVLNSHSRP
jgi:hypothetical protein